MNCGTCKHWNLNDSRLAPYGYGTCNARKHEADRMAISTSSQNICRIERFAKADPKVVAKREKEMASLL